MSYLTYWDVNTFLCLIYWGLPDDVVSRMMKMTKKVHQEFTLGEALGYWNTNSPMLTVMRSETRLAEHAHINGVNIKFQISDILEFPQIRIDVFKRRHNMTREFKKEWRLRSIEERQKKVADWCYFGSNQEQQRHQRRLNKVHMPMVRSKAMVKTDSKLLKEREEYTKNLWPSWDAGASSYYFVGSNRRDNVRKWYEGIHPGRFFLFYRENKVIQERNRGVPKGPCEDGYQYPKTPIYDWGPYEQLIEDLRCIDGPGLGEKAGSTVEHIDDLFSK